MNPLWPITIGILIGSLMSVVLWMLWDFSDWLIVWRFRQMERALRKRIFEEWLTSMTALGDAFSDIAHCSQQLADTFHEIAVALRALDNDGMAPWVLADLFRLHEWDTAMEARRRTQNLRLRNSAEYGMVD